MIKQLRIAVIVTVLMMVGTGLVYPLVMTGLAKVVFPNQANGSLIKKDGVTIGSSLIGQSFVDPNTDLTLPGYFRSRPSAAGAGYDAGVSSGSNLGPTNQVLIDRVTADVAAIRTENGLAANATIPVDLVTPSGGGLDPAISPAAAALQVARVAKQRGLTEDQVRGVLELASFESFDSTHQAFLDQLTESIGIVINTIEANTRTEDLLKQSQSLANELQSQQDQLQRTNDELAEKARQLVQHFRKMFKCCEVSVTAAHGQLSVRQVIC